MPRGSPPKFSLVEMILVLLELDTSYEKEGEILGIGRYRLADKFALTKASVRTMLQKLAGEELIEAGKGVGRRGSRITKKGHEVASRINEQIIPTKLAALPEDAKIGECYCALWIKSPRDINLGIRQRDLALFAGGTGAITLVPKEGQLYFPDNYASGVQTMKKIMDQGVLLIGFGRTTESAKLAAYNAAIDLLTEPVLISFEQLLNISSNIPRFASRTPF